MSKLRVAHIAPIFYPLPVRGYGGIERVIQELLTVQMHHPVHPILYASADSTLDRDIPGLDLRRTVASLAKEIAGSAPTLAAGGGPGGLPDASTKDLTVRLNFLHLAKALHEARSADLIHAHGMWVLAMEQLANRPLIVSLYENTAEPDNQRSILSARRACFVANSPTTRRHLPMANWVGTVLEGIIPQQYPFSSVKEGYFVFIGRLARRKGCHTAIEVAKRLRIPLLIIGPIFPGDPYFASCIAPHVDGQAVQYLGELGPERLEVLKRAAALLFPIEWEEPFGRIQAEAAACGTPVVAYRRGAVPDVVVHGVTGFIAETLDEFVAYAANVGAIRPAACRQHAETALTMERVAAEYDQVYQQVFQAQGQ